MLRFPKSLIYPAVFAGSLGLFYWLQTTELPVAASLFLLTAINLAVIAVFEWFVPYRVSWAWWHDRQAPTDIIHGVLLSVVGPRLGEMVLGSLAIAGAAALTQKMGGTVWPFAWPLPLQILLAILIADFTDWTKHWLYHNMPLLWPVHALHHNAEVLHVTKAARLHFLESSVRYAVITAPLLVLGAPPEVIVWYGAIMNVVGNLNHANIDMPMPNWLHYVFASPQVHRLHHSIDRDLGKSNLSPGTLIPDHIFGTFRHPARFALKDVGIAENPIPRKFWLEILSPLVWPWLVRRKRLAHAS